MHDPRIGRFFAVDPMVHAFPWYSPYQFSGNTPIMSTELEGLEPEVDENQQLVGYTIQRGQGLTQITHDLNNKETQKKHGYTLQKTVDWTEVVSQNEAYYTEKGHWGTSDMLDANNPTWNNLNSNKGESLVFSQSVDNPGIPATITQATTSKSISSDLVGLDDNTVNVHKFFSSDWGVGGNGDVMGFVKRRPGESYQTESFDGGAPFGGGDMASKGVRLLGRITKNLSIAIKKLAKVAIGLWGDDNPTNDIKPQTENVAEEVKTATFDIPKSTLGKPMPNMFWRETGANPSTLLPNKTKETVTVSKKDSANVMNEAIKKVRKNDSTAKAYNKKR